MCLNFLKPHHITLNQTPPNQIKPHHTTPRRTKYTYTSTIQHRSTQGYSSLFHATTQQNTINALLCTTLHYKVPQQYLAARNSPSYNNPHHATQPHTMYCPSLLVYAQRITGNTYHITLHPTKVDHTKPHCIQL